MFRVGILYDHPKLVAHSLVSFVSLTQNCSGFELLRVFFVWNFMRSCENGLYGWNEWTTRLVRFWSLGGGEVWCFPVEILKCFMNFICGTFSTCNFTSNRSKIFSYSD